MPKAARKGASLTFRPAGPSASAYKYRAITTLIVIERRATGWFLVNVQRDEVFAKQGGIYAMRITPEQRDEIARRAVEDFIVVSDEEMADALTEKFG